jgi:hypothetical protein
VTRTSSFKHESGLLNFEIAALFLHSPGITMPITPPKREPCKSGNRRERICATDVALYKLKAMQTSFMQAQAALRPCTAAFYKRAPASRREAHEWNFSTMHFATIKSVRCLAGRAERNKREYANSTRLGLDKRHFADSPSFMLIVTFCFMLAGL